MPAIFQRSNLPFFFLLGAAAIWGVATPVIKATVGYVPPITFLMLRFWISAFLLLPVGIWYIKRNKINPTRWRHMLSASTLGTVLALAFIFMGLNMTSAIEGSILNSFSPLLTTALSFIILKEVITKNEMKGILIAFIGALIIILAPIFMDRSIFNGARLALLGNVLYFLGVLLDSSNTIYIKKNISTDKIITPFMLITFSFIFAAIVFTPLGFLEQRNLYKETFPSRFLDIRYCTPTDIDKAIYTEIAKCSNETCFYKSTNETICKIKHKESFFSYVSNNLQSYMEFPSVIGILYMALISGIVAYTLYYVGLGKTQVGQASFFHYLQPLFGIPVAVLLLKEELSIYFLIGAIIIIVGIYIGENKHFKRKTPVETVTD